VRAIGIFLLVAVLLGVAAALLTGAPPTPKIPPSQNGTFVTWSDLQIFGYAVIGLIVLWVVYRVVLRVRDPSATGGLGRLGVSFVVAFALCLLFLVVAHLIAHPAGGGAAAPSPLQNMTGPPPMQNTTPGSPSNVTIGSTQFPGWTLYVGILVVGAFLAIVAVPAVYALLRRPPPAPDRAAVGAREAIASTIARLESDPAADPRELIIALYGQLLHRVGPRIDDLDSRTAREVERAAVTQLRLPAAAARDLTALFEEARYSPHAMGPRDSARARAALERILDSLGPIAEAAGS
jgi:hypothetical protein